jgi:predicted transcriptional regulator
MQQNRSLKHYTPQQSTHSHSRKHCAAEKHLIFGRKKVLSNKKNIENSNVVDIFSRCWVWFCVDFYKEHYDLTKIECDIVAYFKWAAKFKMEILTQRVLAKQLGIARSTLCLALPKLVEKDILTHVTTQYSTYAHDNKREFRYIYKFNASCEKPMRNTKIGPLKEHSSLNNRIVPTLSQKFDEFEKSFQQYRHLFPKSEQENLKTSLWNWAVKWKNRCPDVQIVEEALDRAKNNKWMKQAHYIGFRDASRSELISKGGQINDYSIYWPKYKHARLNFLWILRHAEEIVSGKYDVKALSTKASNENAQGKHWKNTSKALDNHTEYMGDIRPEKPAEEWKATITDKSSCKEESALRMQLLEKHGSYAYENWFAKCGWSKEAGQLSHDSAFYRAEIRRKYGVDIWRKGEKK